MRKELRGGRSDVEEGDDKKYKNLKKKVNEKVARGRIVDHLGLVFRFAW